MLDELSEAYNALRLGKSPCLPLVRLQYPDFAAWQARRAQSPAILRQVATHCISYPPAWFFFQACCRCCAL